MRPFRFVLLLAIFVALPIALTCWSLFTAVDSAADSFHAGYNTRSSRLRSLFSFSTPSSLFPPSAVISLTNDNSTFFLARPAAFGPSLPSRGLSGQLWVGKGFGDDALLKEESVHVAGWELGCSDVPGWGESVHKHLQQLHPDQIKKKTAVVPRDLPPNHHSSDAPHDESDPLSDGSRDIDDGTDDYLHHPLQDSNPATPGRPGEPASADQADKTKQPTHADIESLQESAAIAGKVVMLARGGCGFLEKVKWAQRRGGIALIVGDNERGAQLTIMYARGDTSNITIPALFTSYTSAHLLSSLVPAEDKDEITIDGQKTSQPTTDKGSIPKPDDGKPVFTSTKTGIRQPTSVADSDSAGAHDDDDGTWVKNVLSAIGLSDNSPFAHAEDSRRPPSSGNIDWVLLEDWDDDQPADSPVKSQSVTVSDRDATPTPSPRPKSTSSHRLEGDDFVIGVQDWRDADLVAPRPTPGSGQAVTKPKNGKEAATETPSRVKPSSTPGATFEGGSITPGSGEYDHQNSNPIGNRPHRGDKPKKPKSGKGDEQPQEEPAEGSWLGFFKSNEPNEGDDKRRPSQDSEASDRKTKGASSRTSGEDQLEGLWVTLTPTSVSTNPFFDTLLVLVVSPLVTLTVVYALLLLRSRIRRRRWRAPKSVVERLPVRTYHTMTTTSSTTSSQIAAPEAFSPTSPLLISTSQDISRRPTNPNRTRSQTTIGVFPSASVDGGSLSQTSPRSPAAAEKTTSTSKFTKRKRYTGRQVECVVCLEEYVDGESQVMSLPCGHEFHADCITPWLVTRRRTCPICKGDVVRSLARANSARWEDDTLSDEQTSDDVQSRVAQTTNDEPSAAIPIPVRLEDDRIDDDVEQGRDAETPLLSASQAQQADRHGQPLWRNIVSASVSRLSGDTLWRQTPVDRNR